MGRRPVQPYEKIPRRTHSEVAVSALAPEQGTSEGFPTKCYTFSLFQSAGVSACYTLDHGIISLCLSQKVKGQKRSAARVETHIPLLCSDDAVVE